MHALAIVVLEHLLLPPNSQSLADQAVACAALPPRGQVLRNAIYGQDHHHAGAEHGIPERIREQHWVKLGIILILTVNVRLANAVLTMVSQGP